MSRYFQNDLKLVSYIHKMLYLRILEALEVKDKRIVLYRGS